APTGTRGAQAPHALQARRADALALSAVPRGQAAAQSLPALRLLQGSGDHRRRRGLAPARWASPYFVLGRRRCSRTTAYAPLGSSLEPCLARSSGRRLSPRRGAVAVEGAEPVGCRPRRGGGPRPG